MDNLLTIEELEKIREEKRTKALTSAITGFNNIVSNAYAMGKDSVEIILNEYNPTENFPGTFFFDSDLELIKPLLDELGWDYEIWRKELQIIQPETLFKKRKAIMRSKSEKYSQYVKIGSKGTSLEKN